MQIKRNAEIDPAGVAVLATETARAATEPASDDDVALRRAGLLIVLIVFGVFGVWASCAPLSSAAHAPGVISVESYRKTVQHLEGGIVKTIQVRDGEAVAKDQVLITIDDTQPRAQLEVYRGELFIALAREARLAPQRDGLREIVYSDELLQHKDDPRAEEAMRMQAQTFRVRKAAYDGEIALYREQIGQLVARAEGLRAQQGSRERLVGSYKAELEDFEALVDEGYVEKQKVRELERNLAFSEGQAGEFTSSLAATQLQISETKLKMLQLHKQLQQEVAKELAEVQADIGALRQKLDSVQDTVTRTVIRAPQAGTVLDLSVHTVGAVVRPGERLLDIVPQNERLIVEAKVSPMDIDRVQVGQLAEIRFSAFKSRATRKVEGTLVALSADRLVEERDQEQKPYFLARVEIPPQAIEELSGSGLVLVAGMPAEVLVHTGERTLLGYLVDPLRDTFARSFIED